MGRWIRFFVMILIGIALGLLYGWVVSPVQYIDTAPDSLREDYKTDFVLMVAEAYGADGDVPLAVRRLALLGGELPEEIVAGAIQSATDLGYATQDISLLQELRRDLLTWNPSLREPES